MQIKTLSQYYQSYQYSLENPEQFWHDIAENFTWHKKWTQVKQGSFANTDIKWFTEAKLNITENCLDRHLPHKANDIAFYLEPNDHEMQIQVKQSITYQELYDDVCKLSNALKELGVKKGDKVCIYMPMIAQAIYAMLACARIGAVHSVIFGGFSANALQDRINDCQAKVIITTDGAYRGNKIISMKDNLDLALQNTSSVEKVLIYKHTMQNIDTIIGRDYDWYELVEKQNKTCPATYIDSEDELFILYTSGSTAKPKGIVHTCGGYMVYVGYSFTNVFQYPNNNHHKPIYWCTADVGWITGHSYIVYGPLLCGASSVLFEGIPTHPNPSRLWQIIDKYQVNIFYTAPTAIRSLQALGLEHVQNCKLDSLKILGTVGEPINEEAWHWYNKNIGKNNCPIVDTWWQTETGGILIAPLAGITPTQPSYATLPLPGIVPVIVDNEGNELEGDNIEGNLCIKYPWPSMLRNIYGDNQRFIDTYFSAYKNLYFTGDGCKRDTNGYKITGRVDDVINVSGHRLGTAEIENAINMHPHIVESAVVGYNHDIKGSAICAFCILHANIDIAINTIDMQQQIQNEVVKHIGKIAKPDKVYIVNGLPKTRSGKIMRRILRKIAEGETNIKQLGDTSTLIDANVINNIIHSITKSEYA